MISRICKECGKTFEVYLSDKRKFCSPECRMKAQSRRQRGEGNPYWKGGVSSKEGVKKYNKKYQKKNKEKIKKQRKEYGQQNKQKVFIRNKKYREENRKSLLEHDKQKYNNRPKNHICIICGKLCANEFFCDNICKGKYQSKMQMGKNNPSWKNDINKICEECGKEFSVLPCCKRQKYCSNECKGIGMSGENGPNWKGGVTALNHRIRDLRENRIWRMSVFERDKYTCVICGNVGGNLEAHHINSFNNIILKNKIISVRKAKKCKELWDVNNGITVCVTCHEMIDKHRFVGKKK